jgi:hypothetical protein
MDEIYSIEAEGKVVLLIRQTVNAEIHNNTITLPAHSLNFSKDSERTKIDCQAFRKFRS